MAKFSILVSLTLMTSLLSAYSKSKQTSRMGLFRIAKHTAV